MPIRLEPFADSHYAAARALWEATDGVGLSGADSQAAITQFLARNPGASYVALDDAKLAATILVGHDGRRGLIHHMAVAASHGVSSSWFQLTGRAAPKALSPQRRASARAWLTSASMRCATCCCVRPTLGANGAASTLVGRL